MDKPSPPPVHAVTPDMSGMSENAAEACGLMRTLANEGRLLLLCTLVDGEKSVGELESRLGYSQPYVSQQLARLRHDGLVQATRDGRVIRYRLADIRVTQVLEALHGAFCQPVE